MAYVTLKNIFKSFEKDRNVIDDVSLDIHDGEFLVIVGPSGCGKSTLLRMIAGLEEPTSGEIYIGNNLVNHVSPKDRNIAMVFQNYALYPHMNVFDNLGFALKLRKTPKIELKKRVQEAAKILDIGDFLKRKPKELSGGQRQRVALGRAIVRKPQVFLFDEPLSNLDAKLRVQMRAEIKRLHKQLGTTMIYVTHDQVEAMTMGDRIVVLNYGISQQVGPPLDIYHNPVNMFVAGFIGSPPMNFLSGRLEDGKFLCTDFSVDLGGFDLKGLQSGDIVLGIRPEGIHLDSDGIALPLVLAEPLGNETILRLQAGHQTVTARIPSLDTAQLKKSVEVRFDLSKVCLFDIGTEERLV
ncbi:MAG: sn-glycerol-3-phosphate ABC transporter ATP-binding protein UgpC [Candidatus Neomarinimicrobiota bacterium]